jgi:NTP pyrophosphatase (non-canonical NTP hydrolase)
MEIREFQRVLGETYLERDRARGVDGTFRWLVEEVGELARALRDGSDADREHEAGDVLAWLASVANLTEVDLEDAVSPYAQGCPRCGHRPCDCPMR